MLGLVCFFGNGNFLAVGTIKLIENFHHLEFGKGSDTHCFPVAGHFVPYRADQNQPTGRNKHTHVVVSKYCIFQEDIGSTRL